MKPNAEEKALAKSIKASLVARGSGAAVPQERLTKAIQLCDSFIFTSIGAPSSIAELKQSISQALTQPAAPKATQQRKAAQRNSTGGQTIDASTRRDETRTASSSHTADASTSRRSSRAGGKGLQDIPEPLLRAKAHLAPNGYGEMALKQDDLVRREDASWAQEKAQLQAGFKAALDEQMEQISKERERQRAEQEAEAAATRQRLRDLQQQMQKEYEEQLMERARRVAVLKQQQEEAAAERRAAAEQAAREHAVQRAELAAAAAAERTAAAAKAAADRARLEAAAHEREQLIRQKQEAAMLQRQKEREYTAECIKAMDAAQAKREQDQEEWRAKQRAKYQRAGGQVLEQQKAAAAAAAEAKAAREAAEYEIKQAADAAARRAKQQAAVQEMMATLDLQVGLQRQQKEAQLQQKERDREAAQLQREAEQAAQKEAKLQAKARKTTMFKEQQQLAMAWNKHRLEELACPMEPTDTWVHKQVMDGKKPGFITLKDRRRL